MNAPFRTPQTHDPLNRTLNYLRLSVTDFCNFKCNYCLPNGFQGKRSDSELSVLEIKALLEAMADLGIQKVRLTGGEPTVRSDLPQIIEVAKSIKGIKEVALTTNGYKLGKRYQDWVSAGLDSLNVSVDSFDPAEFHRITGKNILPQLLADLDTVLDSGCLQVKLNATLMKTGVQQVLRDALNYVKHRSVSVRFIELMQTTDNTQVFFAEHQQGFGLTNTLESLGWSKQTRSATSGPAHEFSHPLHAGKIGLIAPYERSFCDSCNRMRVSAQGKLHLCLFDTANHNLRPYLIDPFALRQLISELTLLKPTAHALHQGNSGLMHNLSLIGG